MKDEVKISFIKASSNYIGNPNSLHGLGLKSRKLINLASKQILDITSLDKREVIYTSSRCEANNLAIYGLLSNYVSNNKNIVILEGCHSSIKEAALRFKDRFDVSFVKDVYDLDISSISLICFCKEEEVKEFNRLYDYKGYSLLDAYDLSFDVSSLVSLMTVSLEKYDLYGIACLIKKDNVVLKSLIKGGDSTTKYRSGTPCMPLIVSFAKYLRLLYKK